MSDPTDRRLRGIRLRFLQQWVVVGVGAFWATVACAHRLDEYLQSALIRVERLGIHLELACTPGVEVAGRVLPWIDTNADGVLSEEERQRYGTRVADDLVVRLDGRRVDLRLAHDQFPAPSELRTGACTLFLEFSLETGELGPGDHRLVLENRHLRSVSVYLVSAVQPRVPRIQMRGLVRSRDQSRAVLTFSVEGGEGGSSGSIKAKPPKRFTSSGKGNRPVKILGRFSRGEFPTE